MRVWSSLAKTRNVDVNMETMAPATLEEVLQKFYVEVRDQYGSEYEPDSLKVKRQAASGPGEKLIHTPSIINSREFAS